MELMISVRLSDNKGTNQQYAVVVPNFEKYTIEDVDVLQKHTRVHDNDYCALSNRRELAYKLEGLLLVAHRSMVKIQKGEGVIK